MPPAESSSATNTGLKIEMVVTLFLIIGIAIVFYQQKAASMQLAQMESRVDQIQVDFSNYQATHTTPASPSVPSASNPSMPSAYPTVVPGGGPGLVSKPPISIVLPKKGETLCRDDFFTFSWKADSKQAEELRIWIDANIPAPPIADVTISYNETGTIGSGAYDWKIGQVNSGANSKFDIPDGDFYRIKYDVVNNGTTIYSGQSDSFSINTCKG